MISCFFCVQLGEVDCWEPECEAGEACCAASAGGNGGVGGITGDAPHRLELAGCAPPHCPSCTVCIIQMY